MKVKIKNSKFGFMYQLENDRGFNYFPNGVTTPEQMKQYFMAGGHSSVKGQYNEPEIQFVDQEGKPTKIYTIKTGETLAGHKFALVDYEKKFLFEADPFVNDTEKLEFFKDHSSMKQDQEASKLESDQERIKYYLSNVTEETKVLYKHFIDEKMTPDVLKELCVNNAKGFGLPAEVEFI